MPAARTTMTLRNRQKKSGGPSSGLVEVMEESSAPPLKRQRKPSEKAVATSQTALPKATTGRKRPAAAPSKVARTTSSLTTLTSENTEELITPTLADLSSSQAPIPHGRSTNRSRGSKSSKQSAVRASQSQQNLSQGGKDLKRKRDITDDPDQHLAALLKQMEEREKVLKAKEAALEEQVAASSRRDEESKSLFAIAQGQRASELFKTLEDVHSCSLCFEVMACPYILTSSLCGHTFCGICLLNWFFTHLHTQCGSWHEALECPLCRSPLPETARDPPRSMDSCPFAPNRYAEEVISAHVKSLAEILEPHASTPAPPSPAKGKGKARVRKEAQAATMDPIFLDGGDEAVGWMKDGTTRREWQSRERIGRDKMNNLAARWRTMSPADFVAFKQSLGL